MALGKDLVREVLVMAMVLMRGKIVGIEEL
jgi:hypothetical protein